MVDVDVLRFRGRSYNVRTVCITGTGGTATRRGCRRGSNGNTKTMIGCLGRRLWLRLRWRRQG